MILEPHEHYLVCGGVPRIPRIMPNWEGCKVPPLRSTPPALASGDADWYAFLCECIGHAKRPKEKYLCSKTALNRRLQNAYREFPITMDFTVALCDAWRHAGYEAFQKMSLGAPVLEYFTWCFDGYKGEYPHEMLVVECPDYMGPTYEAIAYHVRRMDGREEDAKIWMVAAVDDFARYQTYLLSDEPPDDLDVRNVCRWEYRIND